MASGTITLSHSWSGSTGTQITVTFTMYYRGNGETWNSSPSSGNCSITFNGETKTFTSQYQKSDTNRNMGSASFTVSRTTADRSLTATGKIKNYSTVYSDPTATDTVTIDAKWHLTVYYHVNGGQIADNPHKYNDTLYFKVPSGSNFINNASSASGTYSKYGSNVWIDTEHYNAYNYGSFGLTRTGYSGKSNAEWNTASNGSGNSFNQDDTSSNTTNVWTTKRLNGGTQITGTGTVNLYANWVANSYTITLDPNGGSGGTSSVSIAYNTPQGSYPSITKPTYTGHHFLGYYSATSGGTQWYNENGSSVRTFNLTAATTWYAHWALNTWTIHFVGNGNTGGSMSDQVHTYGTTLALTANAFTKTGYDFYQWKRTDSNNEDHYYADRYSMPGTWTSTNGNTFDFVAQWAQNYTVTYSTAHGTAPSSQTLKYSAATTAASALTDSYYTFGGWKRSDTNEVISAGTTIKAANVLPTQNITLTAQWTAKTTDVTFNPNNGKLDGNGNWGSDANTTNSHVNTLTCDKSYYYAHGKATRVGYVFAGWNTKSDGTGYNVYDSNGACTTSGNYWSGTGSSAKWIYTGSTLNLYAKWTEAKVTIYYHANEGKIPSGYSTSDGMWRVGAGGLIERSTDNGSTWANITSTITAQETYHNIWDVSSFGLTRDHYTITATSAYALDGHGTTNLFNQQNNASTDTNVVTTTRLNRGTQISSNIDVILYPNWNPTTTTTTVTANAKIWGQANNVWNFTPSIWVKKNGQWIPVIAIWALVNNVWKHILGGTNS